MGAPAGEYRKKCESTVRNRNDSRNPGRVLCGEVLTYLTIAEVHALCLPRDALTGGRGMTMRQFLASFLQLPPS